MTCKTNPQTGLAGTALPAEYQSLTEWARAAGEAHACELLACVVFFQGQEVTVEQQSEAGRAVLCGFISPLLPLLTEALALFGDDARAGLLSGLLEDLAHGAALVLEQMDDGGAA